MPPLNRALLATVALAVLLPACTVGPNYVRPAASAPPAFKEGLGWTFAAPADDTPRGEWWKTFNDPILDDLIAQVEVSNQNLAAAAASYAQARALVRETRAAYFPVVTANGSGTRTQTGGNGGSSVQTDANGLPIVTSGTSNVSNRTRINIGATWEPDIWGRIRRSVEQARGQAQASAADLANARLSAQGELAINYFQLRSLDAESDVIDLSIAAYQRALKITSNRYVAGVAGRVDVLQAQTQLESAQADGVDLRRQRAVLEHAVAVLVGKAPSEFSIPKGKWVTATPPVPLGVPSELLQRRPDISSAERAVAAANAGIGIEQAAFYPSLSITSSLGSTATGFGSLFSASAAAWSLGASVLQTIFDAGARRARVAGARAAYDLTVANYRQTVLTAIQQVEDQLVTARVLSEQNELRTRSSDAASRVEAITLNQYLAGQIAYTDVVVAQNTALTARRTLIGVTRDRQTTAVSLIQALGGDFVAGQTPGTAVPGAVATGNGRDPAK